mmetsp:Transcript_3581/g.8234  ORF Transcript_3581/g.8234 Transcript_3581/m.8234 type:complete len:206 (-) Transcript_3581:1282-1899(-)
MPVAEALLIAAALEPVLSRQTPWPTQEVAHGEGQQVLPETIPDVVVFSKNEGVDGGSTECNCPCKAPPTRHVDIASLVAASVQWAEKDLVDRDLAGRPLVVVDRGIDKEVGAVWVLVDLAPAPVLAVSKEGTVKAPPVEPVHHALELAEHGLHENGHEEEHLDRVPVVAQVEKGLLRNGAKHPQLQEAPDEDRDHHRAHDVQEGH